MLEHVFGFAGSVVDGVEGLRSRSAAAARARQRAQWDEFDAAQQQRSQAAAQQLEASMDRQEERFPRQAGQVLAIQNQAADAELQRTQTLQGGQAEIAKGVLSHAGNVQGGLDATRTTNQLRLFEPIKELTARQQDHDLRMAERFVGNDPGNPLIDRVNNTALAMSQERSQLIRELAQMNQPSALDRVMNLGVIAAALFAK